MTKLLWDQVGGRFYETGVDRGVLYSSDNRGVSWNGLILVEEDFSDDTSSPLYFDGIKFLDRSLFGDFSAKIKAFTYPEEFLEFEGVSGIGQGSKTFSLSYRTLVGNDVDHTDLNYKIHILYNLTTVQPGNNYATSTQVMNPLEFEWSIASVCEALAGYRPTAHAILDSQYFTRSQLAELEDRLYGTETLDAQLPSLQELTDMILGWMLIIITDHRDGTWSAEGPDELITMLDPTTFQITEVDAIYLDGSTYNVSTTPG